MSEVPESYERARAAYLRTLKPTRCERLEARLCVIIANVWHKCWGGILLAIATSFLALGLSAQEVPSWVLRGIAQVETGTTWRDIGDLTYRDRRVGDAGEVGPWQLSPAVLRDLRAYDRRARVHADPVFAESLTRAWLLQLYRATGNWSQAVAAYHAGLGRRSESFATTYANRVRAAGAIN